MCLAYQSGSGTRFKYEHNPMDNPKAARDIIENPDAVYGFSPNSESTRIGKYADKIDWTNPEQVAVARQTREAYHNVNESMLQDLYNSGYTTKDIAAKMVEERNMNRINSYINNDRWNLVSHTTFQWSVCHTIKSVFSKKLLLL